VKCTRSHNAAVFAKKLGYKNVYCFPGGIFAWKGADHPAKKVKKKMVLGWSVKTYFRE